MKVDHVICQAGGELWKKYQGNSFPERLFLPLVAALISSARCSLQDST